MKKFLKIGCLVIIVIIVGIFALGAIGSAFSGNETTDETETPKEIVVETPKRPLLTDSITELILDNKFRIKRDDFKKTAFYEHKLSPKYVNSDWIYPYIGQKENNIFIRIKMQYEDDDWLFIRKVDFLVDGEPIEFATGSFERDNDGGRIWEWGDLPVDGPMTTLLMRIGNSKQTKVRYTGNQYHDDREITNNEKKVILETLAVYDSLIKFR